MGCLFYGQIVRQTRAKFRLSISKGSRGFDLPLSATESLSLALSCSNHRKASPSGLDPTKLGFHLAYDLPRGRATRVTHNDAISTCIQQGSVMRL
jgi:hypothetical protein